MTSQLSKPVNERFIAWVKQYAEKVCPLGCIPTPGQVQDISLLADVARALNDQQAAPEPAAWQMKIKGRWNNLPEDWEGSKNLAGHEYRPLYVIPAQSKPSRDSVIEECRQAAINALMGFSRGDYVLEGPGGMGRRMVNAILALKSSDGGVEGHAISGTSSASEQSRSPETPIAGIKPSPSEALSPQDIQSSDGGDQSVVAPKGHRGPSLQAGIGGEIDPIGGVAPTPSEAIAPQDSETTSRDAKDLRALRLALDGGPKPRCRDCADEPGICPGDKLPCDPQERALAQIETLRAASKHSQEATEGFPPIVDSRAEIMRLRGELAKANVVVERKGQQRALDFEKCAQLAETCFNRSTGEQYDNGFIAGCKKAAAQIRDYASRCSFSSEQS